MAVIAKRTQCAIHRHSIPSAHALRNERTRCGPDLPYEGFARRVSADRRVVTAFATSVHLRRQLARRDGTDSG